MAAHSLEPFELEDRNPILAAWPWVIVAALVAALVWFVYSQLTAVRGIKVEAPSPQVVSMLPPPPPPPPPPPEIKEKPPEPTEQPQPSPAEAPKAPQPQAAPVTVAAPAQAGTDAYGVKAGPGGGTGAPSSTGTCLGTNCGAAPSGNGMTEGLYRQYLSSALEERVRGDDKLSRLVFSADLALTVTADGRVTGVRLLGARGRNDDATMEKLASLLGSVRGLNAPPPSMVFPQRVTVRGRRGI
ncbi:TonB-dependent receptor [Sphingomonas sp. dw_22]|uniref:TonB-dependent receptor n=1 Tax=Sphingomonas sp. dw_22 TaxID=2721175 RepID=UPI001BD66D03|nr:TonB-dependent receptor [Sphingomonas sp. dw_22]